MISSRLVQSASHSGIGISPASIRPISILRNGGHQNSRNCLSDMKASGAQWIGMNTIGLPEPLALATVMRSRKIDALSSICSSLSRLR